MFPIILTRVCRSKQDALDFQLMDSIYEWQCEGVNCPHTQEVHDFLKSYKKSFIRKSFQKNSNITFSDDQLNILGLFREQINSTLNNTYIYPTKRCIIQEKAGSGKSTLIIEMIRIAKEILGDDSIAVAAPLGAAALHINGLTLHNLLKICINTKVYEPLNAEKANKFRNNFLNLKFLIVDEISMVGMQLLYHIEKRCREIHPSCDEPFGGLFVYFVGDFNQLPPIKDIPVYSDTFKTSMTLGGYMVFQSFQKFYELLMVQ